MTNPVSVSPQPLAIASLNLYEDQLLNALAFFRTQRQPEIQARHCLSMYLRQSEERIMKEVGFYAHHCAMSPEAFLDLIYHDPDRAQALIQQITHPELSAPNDSSPAFKSTQNQQGETG